MLREATPVETPSICWQDLGAELVFTQDALGRYLSFYWQSAPQYNLNPEQIIGDHLSKTFAPIPLEIYQERIERILERHIPEQCHCQFEYQGHLFPFELVISPILPSHGEPSKVMVIGHQLQETDIALTISSPLPVNPDPYQKLLTQIARNIRRTLDLDIIWQQTVDSLGEALEVSRCLLLSYDGEKQLFKIEAEYRQLGYRSMLGLQLELDSEPYLQQVLDSKNFVIVDQIIKDTFNQQSLLIAPTFYQRQRNAFIWFQQCDRHRHWKLAELELIQELADQVGTAIAHATLYQELKQARTQAEEASRLKSEFLATTTHELRTPLNGILGFLRLILDEMTDSKEEEEQFIQESYDSALHLLDIINDILDIAKIEAGKMEIDLAPLELDELLDEAERYAHGQITKKNLSFEIEKPDTYDKIILYGDFLRLKQVLINLISNAVKFTHEGGIIITVEVVSKKLKRLDQEFPGMVKIKVSDTGIGVPLEKQETLFQNFCQVDGSRTKKYGGTGLGLAISRRLIEAMGGKINLFSMGEGLGSTVTFTVLLFQVPVFKS
jgi:signal transduction histidine kinase